MPEACPHKPKSRSRGSISSRKIHRTKSERPSPTGRGGWADAPLGGYTEPRLRRRALFQASHHCDQDEKKNMKRVTVARPRPATGGQFFVTTANIWPPYADLYEALSQWHRPFLPQPLVE